jgi:hypothetical protein
MSAQNHLDKARQYLNEVMIRNNKNGNKKPLGILNPLYKKGKESSQSLDQPNLVSPLKLFSPMNKVTTSDFSSFPSIKYPD